MDSGLKLKAIYHICSAEHFSSFILFPSLQNANIDSANFQPQKLDLLGTFKEKEKLINFDLLIPVLWSSLLYFEVKRLK